jgi:hypothetical protein
MRLLLTAVLAGLAACAGPSKQNVPPPDESSAVAPDATRVYVGRRSQTTGSWRNVRVFDNEREIGVLGEDGYLVWDRPARRGVARFVFEGLGFDQDAVEGMCELPAEPGAKVYLGITITSDRKKPVIERVGEARAIEALESRHLAKPE